MKIELLYFDACPSWKNTLQLFSEILKARNISDEVILTSVESQEAAEKNKFVGSPTIRINGADIFPSNTDQFALGCRVYVTPEGLRGTPTKKMLTEALEAFI